MFKAQRCGGENKHQLLSAVASEMRLLTDVIDKLWGRDDVEGLSQELMMTWQASFYNTLGMIMHMDGNPAAALEDYAGAKYLRKDCEVAERIVACHIEMGNFNAAVWEINDMSREGIVGMRESTARNILQWCLDHEGIALGVRAEIVKVCVELLAKHAVPSISLRREPSDKA